MENRAGRAAGNLYNGRMPEDAPQTATHSSGLQRLVRKEFVGYAMPGISRDTLVRLTDFPELPLHAHARDVVKAGRSALLVRAELPIGAGMQAVAYKRITRHSRWKRLANLFRKNRTLSTFSAARELLKRGISTARPIAVVIPRRHRFNRPSYLLSEWIPHAQNLMQFAEYVSEHPRMPQSRLRQGLFAVAQLVSDMHTAGVAHRDLKAGNLLLRKELRQPLTAYVIDLDGVTCSRHVNITRRLRDLSRLGRASLSMPGVSHSERLRFLQRYLEQSGCGLPWKTAWRRMQQRIESHVPREIREGRRHSASPAASRTNRAA